MRSENPVAQLNVGLKYKYPNTKWYYSIYKAQNSWLIISDPKSVFRFRKLRERCISQSLADVITSYLSGWRLRAHKPLWVGIRWVRRYNLYEDAWRSAFWSCDRATPATAASRQYERSHDIGDASDTADREGSIDEETLTGPKKGLKVSDAGRLRTNPSEPEGFKNAVPTSDYG